MRKEGIIKTTLLMINGGANEQTSTGCPKHRLRIVILSMIFFQRIVNSSSAKGVTEEVYITSCCARVLKQAWPQLKVYAVEPTASPVISGGAPSPHPIQGIGAGFIPANLDMSLLDGVIQVEAEAAREMGRRAAREEGMLVGISSGATLAAIAQKLPDLPAGAKVLGFCYDTGERYLSVEGYLPA